MSARDRAWGLWYAKRGARRVITRSDAVQTNAQRIADWASRYYLVPVEMRIGTNNHTPASPAKDL